MRILFHRHTPWQGEVRCSTNILATLFQDDGWHVSYMQGMAHIGNLLAGSGQAGSWKRGFRDSAGVTVFTPFSALPHSRRWPFSSRFAARMSFRTCVPSIRETLDRAGFGEPDVIWTAHPGSSALKKLFPNALLVFHVVDYYPAFVPGPIRAIEQSDYGQADHVFVIGEALRRHVESLGTDPSRLTVLGQGVHLERFSSAAPKPEDIEDLPEPMAIWVGVTDKADPQLMEAAAEELQRLGGSLILIGPTAPWADALGRRYGNVRVLGPRLPDQVSAYMANAQLGLMLYDRAKSDVYRGQNPLKLYEYAAAGLAIVSTPHEEYRFGRVPVEVVTDSRSVSRAIERVTRSLESYSELARAFARERSWTKVYGKARRVIDSLLTTSAVADSQCRDIGSAS